MKAQATGDTSGWFGLPRWIALFLAVGVIVGAGFLLWLTAQAFSRSSTLDAQRVRALNIAADYIAKWPGVATTIGQTSLYHRSKAAPTENGAGNVFYAHLYHPEFGDFQIEYDRGQYKCPTTVQIYTNQMTVSGEALKASDTLPEPEKTYVDVARKASWIPLENNGNPVCFKIAKLDLGKVAPPLGSFSHLLLIQESANDKSAPADQQTSWRNGRVVAWVGPSELPIRRLSDLPALQSEVSQVIAAAQATYNATTNQTAVQPRNFGATDALEPFDSRVAGKSYRFYWRPIVLDLPGDNDATQPPQTYYLVGAAPTGAAPESGKARTEVLAFAVVLFMLIALVPVVKLTLLGPVDSMKAIEVTAICVGIVAATALGTALWIGVRDVLVARSAASSQVAAAATELVGKIENDLHEALLSIQMDELSRDFRQSGPGLVADIDPARATTGPSPIVKVENTVLLDDNGRQALGTVINAARDNVGANFDLSDRVYFRRSVDQDFAPKSQYLVGLLNRRGQGHCHIWKDIGDGLAFDQIRSRTDGAPKTIVAAKLNKAALSLDCGTRTAQTDERLQPSVIAAAFVMPSMVSPTLESGIRYAVVDLRRDAIEHPVLFHSDSYRAGVELFDESLDGRTRAKLFQEIGDPVDCDPHKGTTDPKEFTGIYEGEATLFAVRRVPCTDWAVAAFKSRRLIDSQAVKPALDAIIAWASLTIIPYLVWMFATLGWADHAWTWMWPEPVRRKKRAYLYLALALVGAVIFATLLVVFGSPLWGLLVSAVAAVAALGWLAWVHYKPRVEDLLRTLADGDAGKWPKWLRDRPQVKKPLRRTLGTIIDLKWLGWAHNKSQAVPDTKGPLDQLTESRFRMFVILLLIAMSVVPVAALGADARAHFAEVSKAEDVAVHEEDDCTQRKSWKAIARMEGVGSPAVNCDSTASSITRPDSFTGWLRKEAGYEDPLKPAAAPAIRWPLGLPELRFTDGFTLISLGLGIFIILILAIWTSMRGLFGFGVAIEAVEYPQLPVVPVWDGCFLDKRALPPRFLVIRAGEYRLRALKKDAVEMDLNDDIRNARNLRLPEPNPKDPKLLLINNLGLLLGDPDGRRKTLERLEQILANQFARQPAKQDGLINNLGLLLRDLDGRRKTLERLRQILAKYFAREPAKQDGRPNYRIAILTSMTPLERLLQSFERERDESDHLDEKQQTIARLERAKHREDMRWSAVFEQFTTYYHAARRRPAPPELADKSYAVKLIWKELEYVPDTAVAAMIWDPRPPVLNEEILSWAEKITEKSNPEPQAIVDYLASNLIEHYHLMWSLSSREERLLLYRIAHGHVPNIARAYALRSLVKRGLVVLDPYPRTMNQSFAQFVKHVEKPETIKKWRENQEHGFWEAVWLPLGLALPLALGVLTLAAIRNGYSIASVIPLIVAAGPALVQAATSAKRTAVA